MISLIIENKHLSDRRLPELDADATMAIAAITLAVDLSVGASGCGIAGAAKGPINAFAVRASLLRREDSFELARRFPVKVETHHVRLHCFLWVLLQHVIWIGVANAVQNSDPSPAPSVVIAPNGTVRVTRVVPVPTTISPEAQRELTTIKLSPDSHETLEEHRTETEKWQAEMGEKSLKLYPTKLATDTIAGVPVRVVTPLAIAPEKASRILINFRIAVTKSPIRVLPSFRSRVTRFARSKSTLTGRR